jgi:hypothetical protein
MAVQSRAALVTHLAAKVASGRGGVAVPSLILERLQCQTAGGGLMPSWLDFAWPLGCWWSVAVPPFKAPTSRRRPSPTSVHVPPQTSVKVTSSVWLCASATKTVTLPMLGVEQVPACGSRLHVIGTERCGPAQLVHSCLLFWGHARSRSPAPTRPLIRHVGCSIQQAGGVAHAHKIPVESGVLAGLQGKVQVTMTKRRRMSPPPPSRSCMARAKQPRSNSCARLDSRGPLEALQRRPVDAGAPLVPFGQQVAVEFGPAHQGCCGEGGGAGLGSGQ